MIACVLNLLEIALDCPYHTHIQQPKALGSDTMLAATIEQLQSNTLHRPVEELNFDNPTEFSTVSPQRATVIPFYRGHKLN